MKIFYIKLSDGEYSKLKIKTKLATLCLLLAFFVSSIFVAFGKNEFYDFISPSEESVEAISNSVIFDFIDAKHQSVNGEASGEVSVFSEKSYENHLNANG